MAMVDFTNAKIEQVLSGYPVEYKYANINSANLQDSEGNKIVSNESISVIKNEQKSMIFGYSGSFITSGTEFYIWNVTPTTKWKVSNISFQNGDTYSFEIPINLVCN